MRCSTHIYNAASKLSKKKSREMSMCRLIYLKNNLPGILFFPENGVVSLF